MITVNHSAESFLHFIPILISLFIFPSAWRVAYSVQESCGHHWWIQPVPVSASLQEPGGKRYLQHQSALMPLNSVKNLCYWLWHPYLLKKYPILALLRWFFMRCFITKILWPRLWFIDSYSQWFRDNATASPIGLQKVGRTGTRETPGFM